MRTSSHTPTQAALYATASAALALLAPPPDLTVSQWADKYAVLPREGAAEPGPWRTDRAPYQREMMDVVNDPDIDTVVYQVASQLGKTASMLNTIFYFAHKDPSPILLVMPTEKQAEDLSKERIATAIRDTPALRPLFQDAKTRSSGNTTLNKNFPGGYLAMAGANAPRGLASRSIRVLCMDEIDGMPASSGTEGDPILLADARTTNFWNRIRMFSSTPTDKGASRVEKLEQQSDQRRYFVPCPQCAAEQLLDFDRLQWPGRDVDGARQQPEDCYYVCSVNGCVITEADKPRMVREGRWVKTNPNPTRGMAGFQLSTMYSPWFTWIKMAQAYLAAVGNPKLMKAFTNTRLGLTYEMVGEGVDQNILSKRRVVYPAQVPQDVLVLTAGVDVQGDRIEYEVVGWGQQDRSWSIEYGILRGDPNQPELWAELDAVLRKQFRHTSGTRMRVTSAFVDSGNNTKRVYAFCGPRQSRRIFACKGIGGVGVPLLKPRPQSRTHRGSVDLRLVGIDTAKEFLYANLKVEDAGVAGYCAFPSGYRDESGAIVQLPLYDKEYFEQLTGEQLITEMDDMTPVRKWVKRRERNEALDCRVYATAALEDLHINWKKLEVLKGSKRRQPEPAAELCVSETNTKPLVAQKSGKKIHKRFRMPGHHFIHS